MRSPERPSIFNRWTALTVAGTALTAAASGLFIYEGLIEEPHKWEKVPDTANLTIRRARDAFGERIVGVIEDANANEDDGHLFMDDGLTIRTRGREFRIASLQPERYRAISPDEIRPVLEANKIRSIAVGEKDVTFYATNGMITLLREDVMRILGYLGEANREYLPVTAGNVAYQLESEILFCDVKESGKCSITFLEKKPASADGEIAMR